MNYNCHKLPVYNICVADVVFRIEGELYNRAKVVIDKDTFIVAGHMANDILTGFYEDGKFTFNYFREITDDENPLIVRGIKKYDSDPVCFDVGCVENLIGTKFTCYQIGMVIEFKDVILTKKCIGEIYKMNSDILELKLD